MLRCLQKIRSGAAAGTRWPSSRICSRTVPAPSPCWRRTWCSGTTARPVAGGPSPTSAPTGWCPSPRGASTARASWSALTTAGALTVRGAVRPSPRRIPAPASTPGAANAGPTPPPRPRGCCLCSAAIPPRRQRCPYPWCPCWRKTHPPGPCRTPSEICPTTPSPCWRTCSM